MSLSTTELDCISGFVCSRKPMDRKGACLSRMPERVNCISYRTTARKEPVIWKENISGGLRSGPRACFDLLLAGVLFFKSRERPMSLSRPPFNYFHMLNEHQRRVCAGCLRIQRANFAALPLAQAPGWRFNSLKSPFIFVPWGPDLLPTLALFRPLR